jgi:hypothetical protein
MWENVDPNFPAAGISGFNMVELAIRQFAHLVANLQESRRVHENARKQTSRILLSGIYFREVKVRDRSVITARPGD